jgi:hypothetical protein
VSVVIQEEPMALLSEHAEIPSAFIVDRIVEENRFSGLLPYTVLVLDEYHNDEQTDRHTNSQTYCE